MQSVCAAVVGKEVGLEGRCSLSAGLEGRYLALLVPTVLLCLLLGASAAGTSVFGVSLKLWTSGSLLEDCFVSLQSEVLPWRAVCCTFVGLTVLCCSVGKLFCTVEKLFCTVEELFCAVEELFVHGRKSVLRRRRAVLHVRKAVALSAASDLWDICSCGSARAEKAFV